MAWRPSPEMGPAIAVKVGDFKNSFHSKPATVKLKSEINDLTKEHLDFDFNVVQRAIAAKSKMRGCKHCGSSINISKLTYSKKRPSEGALNRDCETNCPVCEGNLLLTDTDKAKEERLADKKNSAILKMAAVEAKVDFKKEPYWLVYAVVPE